MRRHPVLSAWPFVVVIMLQTAIGGFSVFTLSTIRAYITNEGLWTRAETQAIYFLTRYLDTGDEAFRLRYDRAIAAPLAYRRAREILDEPAPDVAAVRAALLQAGASPADAPKLIWMFQHFRGMPFLETSIRLWKETDPSILELDSFGRATASVAGDPAALKAELERIEARIAPRAIAFSSALNDGARLVESLLIYANILFACLLAALTVWRVGSVMRQRRRIADRLAWQASHDELTGLANRRSLVEALAALLDGGRGGAQRRCALAFLDLDQFKVVNDTCGHAAGDALLRQICPAIAGALRPGDLIARFGGDEFTVVMPDTAPDEALAVVERVRAAVEQLHFVWQGRPFAVTVSIGLVNAWSGLVSSDEMISRADMACFLAKEKGRNRIHAHDDGDPELIGRMREMNWVQRIHKAVAEDRFCLFAQEIVPLAGDADGLHLEVLIRLRDENGALVPPSAFLPAAERFGLMKLIDRWVVRTTFRTLAARRAAQARMPALPPIGCCAINLSGATIGDASFLAFLKDAFVEFGIAPAGICFEVTETAAITNLDAANLFIAELRRIGCAFALDDFGSGMSSFTYLKQLPADYIKIDGAFVRNFMNDRSDRAMIEMICHVGHIMGKKIVAEFVGSESVCDALREIGVDFGQGYGLAEPQPFAPDFPGRGAITLPRGEPVRRSA